jgi:peptidoglycan/xylan/chitin deacetylase (PgdA/CDA1 family)
MPIAKRQLASELCAGMAFTRLIEWMPKRRLLMVLNYHRIGNAEECPYDSGTFSATAGEFEAQVGYLKRHFHLTSLEEAIGIAAGGGPSGTSVLITFDDGYRDNYTLAFPILRSHGAQGVFFLPTSFVGTGRLPWWDVIAYIAKRSRKKSIRLDYPESVEFDIERDGLAQVIRRLLRLYKRPTMQEPERFLSTLEASCESARPQSATERCFLNWAEAREMQEAGMAFGSHTRTHEILAKLPVEQQQQELRQSREILETELKRRVDVLAYPVGGRGAFSDKTIEALERTGYRGAFSFYGGMNIPGKTDRFNIRRYGINGQSYALFRLETSASAFTGGRWFCG